jgi:probable rRNA maturation factor
VNIDLQVDNPYAVHVDAEQLKRAVQLTINLFHPDPDTDLDIVVLITDDATVTALNREYRGIDAATDVLSFENEADPDFPGVDPEIETHLGDIVISYQVAAHQALQAGHRPMSEVILLAVHGTLHLLGFDHDTVARKSAMWAAQQQVLDSLGLSDVLPTES